MTTEGCWRCSAEARTGGEGREGELKYRLWKRRKGRKGGGDGGAAVEKKEVVEGEVMEAQPLPFHYSAALASPRRASPSPASSLAMLLCLLPGCLLDGG